MDPIWAVALATSVAAASAALGALPFRARTGVPRKWLVWANTFAAGLMLGVAFVLAQIGLGMNPVTGMAGALVGILFLYWTHDFAGTSDLDLDRVDEVDPSYGPRVLFDHAIHGASEGVAIGVAAVLDLRLGVFVALSLAVHNVAESLVLCAVLRSQGAGVARSAGLAVLSNAGQILLAVATFALVASAPVLQSPALGFATGGVVYLVFVDLLPEAYEEGGDTTIALATSLVIGVVILLEAIVHP